MVSALEKILSRITLDSAQVLKNLQDEWREERHARVPAGRYEGGEFAHTGSGTQASSTPEKKISTPENTPLHTVSKSQSTPLEKPEIREKTQEPKHIEKPAEEKTTEPQKLNIASKLTPKEQKLFDLKLKRAKEVAELITPQKRSTALDSNPIGKEVADDLAKAGFSPDVISAVPVSVNFSSEAITSDFLPGEFEGMYYPASKTISISKAFSASKQTFIHEFGHHLDFSTDELITKLGWDGEDLLSSQYHMVKEIKAAMQEAASSNSEYKIPGKDETSPHEMLRAKDIKKAPSAYALANNLEWIAEATVLYVENPLQLKRKCPATFSHLNKYFTNTFKKDSI